MNNNVQQHNMTYKFFEKLYVDNELVRKHNLVEQSYDGASNTREEPPIWWIWWLVTVWLRAIDGNNRIVINISYSIWSNRNRCGITSCGLYHDRKKLFKTLSTSKIQTPKYNVRKKTRIMSCELDIEINTDCIVDTFAKNSPFLLKSLNS